MTYRQYSNPYFFKYNYLAISHNYLQEISAKKIDCLILRFCYFKHVIDKVIQSL